ncbi:uncharacterized protein [Parasteatoda tepidariorum]|uniref:uncharacterized protein isoform X2 n=1 Tax=Parasteatoda tepidariorum TaxID=114398 RepID=UPI00077FAB66|nr:uncharacterized protein LOC107442051 isoform X2 [Parasteatoda tepidariorum]
MLMQLTVDISIRIPVPVNRIHQITRDSTDNYKNVGLKISTNINCEMKSNPDSVEKSKKESSRAMKSCPEIEVKNQENVLKDTNKSKDLEEWPEIESMRDCIYEGLTDVYEDDIIPENLSLSEDELDSFYVGRSDDETEKSILNFTFDDDENELVELPLAFIPSSPEDWI